MSEQTGILPAIPILEVASVRTGEEGRLTLAGRRLVFVTGEGVKFGVDLNNIVNLDVNGDIVELDTRLSGVTIRAVRFKALNNDALRWFRGVFFAWVISKRRESKLVIDWEPVSYMTRKTPGGTRGEKALEHDYLLSRLVGNKENRARFSELLGPAGVVRLKAQTRGFAKHVVIDKVAAIEFDKMAAAVFRGGWRDSFESFDKGSPAAFQSALPTISQRGMREEFWGWYDVNQMLFERFRQAERVGDRVAGLLVKRVAAMVRERIGEYAGLADDALQRRAPAAALDKART